MAWGVGLIFWVFFVTPNGMGIYSATPVDIGTGGCLSVVSPATPCDLGVSPVTPMGLGGGGVLSEIILGSPGGLWESTATTGSQVDPYQGSYIWSLPMAWGPRMESRGFVRTSFNRI